MTIDDYMKLNYDIVVVPEECTDGSLCYRAEHPQLPGCMSHGVTPEEALINLVEAKRLYIQTLLDNGLEVPLPVSTSGGTYSSYCSITSIITHEKKLTTSTLKVIDKPKEIQLKVA
ncbi:MAG: type II toxin-antitoxin system HicB family antitoxin [Thermodesulfovibrionales bacterium]